MSGVSAIAAGAAHSTALSELSVWTWGSNQVGQLGVADLPSSARPLRLDAPYYVKAVASGWFHNVVILNDGSTWTWGWNYFGQLGTDTTADSRTPIRIPQFAAVSVAAGVAHTVAISSRGV
jgi:YD repeat-containing protein